MKTEVVSAVKSYLRKQKFKPVARDVQSSTSPNNVGESVKHQLSALPAKRKRITRPLAGRLLQKYRAEGKEIELGSTDTGSTKKKERYTRKGDTRKGETIDVNPTLGTSVSRP